MSKKILFRLCFTILTMLTSHFLNTLYAQDNQKRTPVDQQYAFFIYNEWKYSSGQQYPKILLISSHIYRVNPPTYSLSDYGFPTKVSLAAYDILKKMEADERIIGTAPYEQLTSDPFQKEWAYYSGLYASGTGDHLKKIYYNTTEYLVALREKIINDYRNKGYRVFQFDFTRNLKPDPTWQGAELERVEKLSTVWIEEYRVGSIKRISQDYNSKNNSKITNSTKTGNNYKSKKGDTEFDHVAFCMNEKNKIWNIIEVARSKATSQAWLNAKNAYEDFYKICSSSYVDLPLAWKSEIDQNLNSIAITEGVLGLKDAVTSSPWSYGYGQFIDSEGGGTYLHRFNFGLSGAYRDKIFSADLSLLTSLMRLPFRTLNYRFEPSDRNIQSNSTKSERVDSIKVFSLSVGPSFTFWPQQNIFVKLVPEAHVGFNNHDHATGFTAFPAINGNVGLRFGKVYLSGTYGAIWKKFAPSSYDSHPGTVNYYNHGPIQGSWVADNFDEGKWKQHKFWMIFFGLDLGNWY